MKSDLVDLDLVVYIETEKAYGIDTGERDANGVLVLAWLPKSMVQKNDDGTFSMPERLAKEKELI